MTTFKTHEIILNDGQTLFLESVTDKNADFSRDKALALESFLNAYQEASSDEIQKHFGSVEDISSYYQDLIEDYDIAPFRAGKLLWIRAYLNNDLIAWMGLEENFRHKNNTYVSTFVLDPQCEGQGIAEKMLQSIVDYWLPETEELNLIVRKINHKAMGFFEKFGFLPAADIDHPYNDNPELCQFMRWAK